MGDLTVGDVVEINRSIVDRFGVTFGVLNMGNLDFVVESAMHSQDVFRKAAELMYGIARGHPFMDGNKRTAFEAAFLTLDSFGIALKVEPKEAEDFMLRIVSSESLTVREVEMWIRRHGDWYE
ncbi:MAG: type II toxin-antitoxin system death-on-curing family toxin [Candidatus Aenigmarchaeota archaeon]|nr:type II toxin-antitoxin system death-on-curing family toxin [Candidatus Aenigmarchaeota archaeon]